MPDALSPAQRALVRVSAALATRDAATIRAAFEAAVPAAPAGAVDEVVLQGHLFVGFPDALEALILWREVAPAAAPADGPEDPALWERRGPQVCARVYGPNYQKLRANVRALHPDLDRWMVIGGYGRVIGRPGLDLLTRELCIAALLAVWNTPRQLHSHLRGAFEAGAAEAQVDEALGIACGLLDPVSAARVQELWAGVRGRRRGTAAGRAAAIGNRR